MPDLASTMSFTGRSRKSDSATESDRGERTAVMNGVVPSRGKRVCMLKRRPAAEGAMETCQTPETEIVVPLQCNIQHYHARVYGYLSVSRSVGLLRRESPIIGLH